MLLVMDVGNTTTVVGLFEGETLRAQWRLTSTLQTSDELGIRLLSLLGTKGVGPDAVEGAAFASVVPMLDFPIRESLWNFFNTEPLQVDAATDTGMEVRYGTPHELGADRLVTAVAGREKYGAPLIVADYGTAITFDAVSRDGAYLGGAIAPGLNSGISALFSKAAKLPQVGLTLPRSVIGRNTNESIQSGIVLGNAGLTDHIVGLLRAEVGAEAKVIATGGHAGLMGKVCRTIDKVDPWLMLDGLRMIYRRVRG
ncbi:MAG: type III pantothenate kinase [Fretibacterium sp.]|nr:type III pantothenate kinase [Fretibacterium sp.]